ncbi:MAG: protein kinase [bacterium]
MEQSGSPNFGRYRLLRRLGQGGMAEVYLAEVAGLGQFRKRIAIKRLLPHYAANERFVSMLRDEAKIAAAIRHPHVAAVLDFGEVEGQHYIAMEYIHGVDLATVLRTLRDRDQLMPIAAAVYVARCVAEGLEAAHSLRDASTGKALAVIHRDVSPHNILVSFEGAVKLIDFGVAKAENNSTKTRSGVIKGKLQYMSPEQAQAHEVDGRSDVFSLGMTLYKLLTGRLPFTGRNEYQIYDQILRKEPSPPRAFVPELPERIDAVVTRALRKDPERRFQSAAEMARVLQLSLWDVDPEYGPHELAALLHEIAPSSEDYDHEVDDDFGTADGSPPVEVAPLAEEEVDRLTRVGPAVAEPELHETQAMALHDPGAQTQVSLESLPATAVVATGDAWPEEALATFHGAVTQIHQAPEAPPEPAIITTAERAVPAPSRRGGWVLLLVALSGIAAALLFSLLHPDAGDRRPDAELRPAVVLPEAARPDAAVADAEPIVDAAPRAAAPGTAEPAAADAGLPDAAPPAEPDAAPPALDAAPPDAGAAAPATRAIQRRPSRGYLTVNALPWANVEVDGRRLRTRTPIRRHPLPAGTHLIRLIGPDGQSWSKRVTVRGGRETNLGHKF